MRKLILSAVVAGSLFASIVGSAFAGSANHTEPGTPGDANCTGQTMAYLAQLGAEADVHGIGGVAGAFGLPVKELKALVAEYCAGS